MAGLFFACRKVNASHLRSLVDDGPLINLAITLCIYWIQFRRASG